MVSDKTIIVTGGSSGIGRASAVLFAANGARVEIPDVKEERRIQVQNEIRELNGEANFVKTDVSNYDDVETVGLI